MHVRQKKELLSFIIIYAYLIYGWMQVKQYLYIFDDGRGPTMFKTYMWQWERSNRGLIVPLHLILLARDTLLSPVTIFFNFLLGMSFSNEFGCMYVLTRKPVSWICCYIPSCPACGYVFVLFLVNIGLFVTTGLYCYLLNR